MGLSNFLVHDPGQANMESDAEYSTDAIRTSGIQTNQLLPSPWLNKVWYQSSTFVGALAAALAAKGYPVSDVNFSVLQSILSNLLTSADLPIPVPTSKGGTGATSLPGAGIMTTGYLPLAISNGGTGATSFAGAGLVTLSQLENYPNNAIGITNSPSTNSGSPSLLAEMTITAGLTGRKVLINFTCEFSNNTTGGNAFFQIWQDGVALGPSLTFSSPTANQNETAQGMWIVTPSAGSHTYAVYWWVTGGTTATASGYNRTLQVTEI
jgi:hypothetical protein